MDFLKNISDRRKDANDVSSNNAVKGHRIRDVINFFKPRSPVLPSRPRRDVNVTSNGRSVSSVENKPRNVVSDGGKDTNNVAGNNIVRNRPQRPRVINVNHIKHRDPKDVSNIAANNAVKGYRIRNVINFFKHKNTKDFNNIAGNNTKDQQPVVNNIKSEDTDIEPSDDSVFHISEAIIADAANLEDKELMSNEKEFTANEVKDKLRSFVSSAESMFKNTPLYALSILNVGGAALKRVHTKVLAKVCTDAFNKIKDDKDIKKCVNDLSDALIRYSKSETFEDCKKIMLIQEKLREAIENYKHIESVNEVLNTVFVRAAVDKFYKKFGDLSNPNAIIRLKSISNSLYEKILYVPAKEKSLKISLGTCFTHFKNLIYGLGFHPSSVDIELENLAGEDVEMMGVPSALGALSKEHALTIKNGKKFEVVNTGSYNDRNCAFRAISIGAGFGPNGYNIVQQKVVEGAHKILEMWDGLDFSLQMRIKMFLTFHINPYDDKEYTLSDVKKLLKEYIDYRGKGFVSGVSGIEFLFAAIGLGRPICVSNNLFREEHTFLPDGSMENGIRDDYSTFGKPVYVGTIFGHAEALLPLDNKGLRKMANKGPELNKKASEMKDAISKRISGVIYEAINEQSSLLEIIARDPSRTGESFIDAFLKNPRCKNDEKFFIPMRILAEVDSKLDADKKAEAYSLKKEIMIIAKNKASGKLAQSQEKVLQNKLKQFGDIFADKAVKLCKEEPLFWDNFKGPYYNTEVHKLVKTLMKNSVFLLG